MTLSIAELAAEPVDADAGPVVWRHSLTVTEYASQIGTAGPLSDSPPIPARYVSGGGGMYMREFAVTRSASNPQLYMSYATTTTGSTTAEGPNFTAAARDNLRFILSVPGAPLVAVELGDADPTDPYLVSTTAEALAWANSVAALPGTTAPLTMTAYDQTLLPTTPPSPPAESGETPHHTTAWAVHLEEPEDPAVIGEAFAWTGGYPLQLGGRTYMPTYGIMDVAPPNDSIGAGYEHARITLSWPRVDQADLDFEIPKTDLSALGLREGQGCHIYMIESLDGGMTWDFSGPGTDYHGKATGFELAQSSAVIDVTPLLGDIDAAVKEWWSSDDRAKEAATYGFLDNSMRYMRRIATRLLSRFPSGPRFIEDDYIP